MNVDQTPVAVSMGEPAGIGPELALMAWANRKQLHLPPFYMRGDAGLVRARAATIGLSVPVLEADPGTHLEQFNRGLPVIQTGPQLKDRPGIEQSDTAQSVVEAIETGVHDVLDGAACALVTLPINKAALYKTGFSFPGHTEFLGELAAKYWPGSSSAPVMMIAGPELMVVPVTIHIPLKDVPAALTSKLIVETAETTAADMRTRFGFPEPRLAICGLNPHAGEDGALGSEDRDIILPAVEELKAKGIQASGPHPADTLFHPPARKHYDCVLGMYHDQVLVPAKTIGFDDSVNVTLGLPFVRTSPDHGTAYGLAGKGIARIDSFAAALRMAHALAHPDQL